MAARQASNAGARCADAAVIATAISPDRQRPDAMVDGDLGPGPLALDLLGDLGQHLLGHLDVRLVLQADDVGQLVALAGERRR